MKMKKNKQRLETVCERILEITKMKGPGQRQDPELDLSLNLFSRKVGCSQNPHEKKSRKLFKSRAEILGLFSSRGRTSVNIRIQGLNSWSLYLHSRGEPEIDRLSLTLFSSFPKIKEMILYLLRRWRCKLLRKKYNTIQEEKKKLKK